MKERIIYHDIVFVPLYNLDNKLQKELEQKHGLKFIQVKEVIQ
jgi:hypothetical protein